MKYFDIEYVKTKNLSEFCFTLTKSSAAARFSEEYYGSLYRKCLKEYQNETKRICRFLKKPYDKELSASEFTLSNTENLEYVKQNLPKDILDSVADVRVLALGAASPEVFDKITSFCGKLYRKCRETENLYESELEKVKNKFGAEKTDTLLKYLFATPKDAYTEGNSLIITVDSDNTSDVLNKRIILDSPADIMGIDYVGQTVCQVELLPEENDSMHLNCLFYQPKDGIYTEFSVSAKNFSFE